MTVKIQTSYIHKMEVARNLNPKVQIASPFTITYFEDIVYFIQILLFDLKKHSTITNSLKFPL